jgi:hypothetical protein
MVGPGSVLAEVVGLSGLAGVGVLEWAQWVQWAQWTQWAGSDVQEMGVAAPVAGTMR